MSAPGSSPASGPRWLRTVLVLALGLWGAYQCFWGLWVENVGGDEYIYTTAGWQYVHGVFDANREHPPTAKYLFGLAQVLGGEGVVAPRVLVSMLTVAVAAIMFLWLRREVGWWAGYLAALFWLVTPRSGAGSRIDRLALLDPVMMAFAVAALATAWLAVKGGRVPLLLGSAVLLALSVTSKLTTIVLVPVFVLLPIVSGAMRPLRRTLLACGGWLLVFGASMVALCAPTGLRTSLRYMLAFQATHNQRGHLVLLDGQVRRFAPWWGNAEFLWRGVTGPVVVVLVAGILAAVFLRPGRLVAVLGGSLALLVGFYTVIARVALPTYYYAWMPFLVMLAAVGLQRLIARPGRAGAVVAAVLVAVALVPSAQLSQRIAALRPAGPALLLPLLEQEGVTTGRILFASYSPSGFLPYVGDRGTLDPERAPFVAIVIGNDPRFPVPPEVRRLLDGQPGRFSMHQLDDLTAWIPREAVVRHGNALALGR